MKTVIIIDAVLISLLLFLVVLKTVHFKKNIKRKRMLDWFYFNRYRIVLSSTPESAAAKKKQNTYTISILLMLFVIALTGYCEVVFLM